MESHYNSVESRTQNYRKRRLEMKHKIFRVLVIFGTIYLNISVYRTASFTEGIAWNIGFTLFVLIAYMHGKSKRKSPEEIIEETIK